MRDEKGGKNRRQAVAGPKGFYPAKPEALRSMVTDYLNKTELKRESAPLGLIAPHAGYIYSGPVAGWAYRQIQGHSYHTVVILAPSHMIPFPFAAVMTSGSYVTPLGEIPVDEDLASRLVKKGGDLVRASDYGHMSGASPAAEHSLEVQLPFLQVALGDFKIVPVVIGISGWDVSRSLGDALAEICDDNMLIVASSDLSHYHGYDDAYRLDGMVIDLIKELDAESLAEGCRTRDLEACGGTPIAALLAAANKIGACEVEILRHKTSGDIPGGMRDQVVGYLAAAVYRSVSEGKSVNQSHNAEESQSGSGLTFSKSEQDYLIGLAKQAVSEALLRKPFKLTEPDRPFPVLDEKRGLFVTLKIGGHLRGCIGNLSPDEPLGELVKRIACQSAFDDPRFPALTVRELERVTFDITVLGKMEKAERPLDVIVGRHGIMIKKGYFQGLLLPQVAVEQGWDREQFLEGVCMKAGLPAGAWREKDTELFLFTADCFGE